MTARSRRRVAKLLVDRADGLMDLITELPASELCAEPRAALEECAAILADAAAELQPKSKQRTVA